jgi:hypothetical protein
MQDQLDEMQYQQDLNNVLKNRQSNNEFDRIFLYVGNSVLGKVHLYKKSVQKSGQEVYFSMQTLSDYPLQLDGYSFKSTTIDAKINCSRNTIQYIKRSYFNLRKLGTVNYPPSESKISDDVSVRVRNYVCR